MEKGDCWRFYSFYVGVKECEVKVCSEVNFSKEFFDSMVKGN